MKTYHEGPTLDGRRGCGSEMIRWNFSEETMMILNTKGKPRGFQME